MGAITFPNAVIPLGFVQVKSSITGSGNYIDTEIGNDLELRKETVRSFPSYA